jgi:hypothetical protein
LESCSPPADVCGRVGPKEYAGPSHRWLLSCIPACSGALFAARTCPTAAKWADRVGSGDVTCHFSCLLLLIVSDCSAEPHPCGSQTTNVTIRPPPSPPPHLAAAAPGAATSGGPGGLGGARGANHPPLPHSGGPRWEAGRHNPAARVGGQAELRSGVPSPLLPAIPGTGGHSQRDGIRCGARMSPVPPHRARPPGSPWRAPYRPAARPCWLSRRRCGPPSRASRCAGRWADPAA